MEKPEPVITELPCVEEQSEPDSSTVNVYFHLSRATESTDTATIEPTNVFNLGVDFSFHSYMDYVSDGLSAFAAYKQMMEEYHGYCAEE